MALATIPIRVAVMPIRLPSHAQKNIPSVFERALRDSGLGIEDIHAVAVTAGPGLGVCLRIGLDYATDICRRHEHLKLLVVNHLEV